mgnify:CR=1 FL=1
MSAETDAALANRVGDELLELVRNSGQPISSVLCAPDVWTKLASHRGIDRNSAAGISMGGCALIEGVHLAPGKVLALIGLRPHDLGTFA